MLRRRLFGNPRQTGLVCLFFVIAATIWSRKLAVPRGDFNIDTNDSELPGEGIDTDVESQRPTLKGSARLEVPVKVVDRDAEEEQLYNQDGEIHITHFFSTFSVPTTSPAYYEMKIVQESWKRAAIRALQDQGLKVEFIDATMPGDIATSPVFAKHVDLNWWLQDVKKGRVPTVGEPFNVVQRIGRGQLMMFTNADIGVTLDFYTRAWKWFSKDFRTPEAQVEAMKYTAQYVANCFFNVGMFNNKVPLEHNEMCLEDSRVFYIHAGGFDQLWKDEDFRVQIALLAIKMQRQSRAEDATYKRVTDLISVFAPTQATSIISEAGAEWREYFAKSQLKVPLPATLKLIPEPLFAGTVTRIDIDVVMNETFWRGPSQSYKDVLQMLPSSGIRHPGNDAFLFHRDHLPKAVKMMGHPVGVRPFGQWLALAWWNSNYPYRRITATKKKPWTFHVGIGLWGMDSIPWRERATENPAYTVFLAANFDRLSDGAFRKMFTGPLVCQNSTVPWRSPKYCNSISNEYCAGMIRFSCYYNFNVNLRDALWYYETCSQMYDKKEARMKRPTCDFCNFMFSLKSSTKRFQCVDGPMEFCQGLGEGVCP